MSNNVMAAYVHLLLIIDTLISVLKCNCAFKHKERFGYNKHLVNNVSYWERTHYLFLLEICQPTIISILHQEAITWLRLVQLMDLYFREVTLCVPERTGTWESAAISKNVPVIFIILSLIFICLLPWTVGVRKSCESIKHFWRCGFERGHI